MRVFVTGATGFVGSAVVQELLKTGHEVLGLARNDAAAQTLLAVGAQVQRGDLQDLDSLRQGAAAADGVIHTAFVHDFQNFKACCDIEGHAVAALGSALLGSDRPMVITSGTLLVSPGQLGIEDTVPVLTSEQFPRAVTEETARTLAARGVRIAVVRLSPSVHGDGDHGFVPMLIDLARKKGLSAYVGEGKNRWTGVHRLDAAHLFRLALEQCVSGGRYHGADEEGIAFRQIAEVIGKRLNLPVVSLSPEQAAEHFGWMAGFAQIDGPASSQLTRERLGWQPSQLGLIADLEQSTHYFNI